MEKQKVSFRERAEGYLRQLNELMDLIEGKLNLEPHEKAQAQDLLRRLKNEFKADNKAPISMQQRLDLNQAEFDFYSVVCEASTRIRVRTNTDPIRQRWYDELYSARIDIADYLGRQD